MLGVLLFGLITPAVPVKAAPPTGGVVLDLFGRIHPFGGASVDTSSAPIWNWDIARALSVLPDGSGGWTLDGFGRIHEWGAPGAAPQITSQAVWNGFDIARDLFVLPDRQSYYILDGWGGVHGFGPHALVATSGSPLWPGWDIARGLTITTDGSGNATGGWILDGFGGAHAFGSPPGLANPATYYNHRDIWNKLHLSDTGQLYAVGRWGVVSAPGMSPSWSGFPDWGSFPAERDVVLLSASGGGGGAQGLRPETQAAWAAATAQLGGVVLDLNGGVHPFGGAAVNTTGAPYWGWNIARAVSVLPDGSGGWTLDGFGRVHEWGTAPAINSPAIWDGRDIARDLFVLPDGQSGYILDGYGGLHEFGAHAPPMSGAYWLGNDIARGITVITNAAGTATGGWMLDGFGGVHPFGSAPAMTDPATYFNNHDVWQKLHLTIDGRPYAVGKFGVVSAPGIAAWWSDYPEWGGWNATRDIVIFNPTVGGDQPASVAARAAFDMASHDMPHGGVVDRPECQSIPLNQPTRGKYIVISLACQELSAYENGHLVLDTLVTTGRPALATDKGHASVIGKNHPFQMVGVWPRGSQYCYPPTWVQYATWIWSNGTAIHDADWQPDSSLGPGSQFGPYASHGCIHASYAVAQWVYAWTNIGTPVDVV